MPTMNCDLLTQAYNVKIEERLKTIPTPLTLATILTHDDPGSAEYQHYLSKDCKQFGIHHLAFQCENDTELQEAIMHCNQSLDVNGILVFYPLGQHITLNKYNVANSVLATKDVEGLHKEHIGSLEQSYDVNGIYPSTPKAIIELLTYYNYPFTGTATILNRSDVVGKPLRLMLEGKGMTVLAAYHKTSDEVVRDMLKDSDLIITAVPNNSYKLHSDMIKQGAAVVAVNPNNIDEDELLGKCSLVTSRKSPIGRITRKVLLENLLELQHR